MPMPELPSKVKLFIACSGIFFSVSYCAVLQEDVYKKPYNGEYFAYTFLALVCERGVNAAIGLLGVMCLGGSGLKIPLMDIFNSGVSQMPRDGSNEALRYVSYPTQVLGKSCKMVPVMLGGIILGGKKYGFFEYLQVLIITGGLLRSTSARAVEERRGHSAYGLGLIGFSLVMDAVTGGLQDKVKRTIELNPDTTKKPVRRPPSATLCARPLQPGLRRRSGPTVFTAGHAPHLQLAHVPVLPRSPPPPSARPHFSFPPSQVPTMHESMLWTNASGFLVAGVLCVVTGQATAGFAFCMRNPEVLTAIMIYSLASAVGQVRRSASEMLLAATASQRRHASRLPVRRVLCWPKPSGALASSAARTSSTTPSPSLDPSC